MKYLVITRHNKTWPVDLMCRLLGVSRDVYYLYCQRRQADQPDPERQALLAAVKEIAEASKTYRCLLKAHGFVGSMSHKGDCWDNAVAESFFASLKT